MKGSSWFPRWERVGHPLHAHVLTHARHPRDAGRRSPRFQHSFERRSPDRSHFALVALARDTHVTLWRVVVPRGAPEPPQPPAPSATDPLHWSYAPWGTPPPPPPRHPGSILQHQHAAPPPAKRALSESDDCDDAFSEESSKDHCPSPGEADSCQMLSRKKRRGIIEKRRRDRINNSLLELRRLVPSAYEKQGSAKLEKAEILQLTVDHLKVLHSKGLDALAYDPSKFAMDYHNIGFRECAAEVARYLVTVEGLDIQDPLRLRLMSHLQCFAAQRELASKQTSWYPPHGQAPGTPGGPGHLHQHQHQSQHQNQLDSTGNSSFDTSCETAASSPSVPSTPSAIPPVSSSQTTLTPLTPVSMSSSASNALYQHHSTGNHHHQSQEQHQQQQQQPQQTPPYHQPHHHHHPHQAPGYHQNPNDISHQNYSSHHPNSSQVSSQMKPYRPWGAEVAY